MTENMAARGEGLAGLVAGDKVLVMVEFLGQRGQEAKIAIKSLGSVTNWDGEAQISVPVAALESPRKLTCAADAEAMLRKRWIGDLDRIPLGKVVEFMQSFAEQYLNLFPPEIQTVLDKRTGEIAALEAAAPAGTAPSQSETDCRAILSLMGKEPYLAKGHVEDGEYQWTVVADKVSVTEMLRAALATPSPQAPQEPTAEHNRLAASLCGCGMPYMSDCERCERIAAALAKVPRSGEQSSGLGRSKGEPFHLSQNAESAPSSVATQEPAGSGAKQRTKPTVEELEAILNSESSTPVEILSDGSVREIAPFGALTECEHQHPRYSCTICSPRKVGEDGGMSEMQAAEGRVALAESVMKLPYIKATRNAEVGQERFVARDDVITAIHEYAKKARAARSSSVPVGEQKQEDGV